MNFCDLYELNIVFGTILENIALRELGPYMSSVCADRSIGARGVVL